MAKDKNSESDAGNIQPQMEGLFGGAGPGTEELRTINPLPLVIHGQYIKDLSIENPNAPASLRTSAGKPAIEVSFSMDARKVEGEDADNLFEVTLGVEAIAKRDNLVAFVVDLQYAVLVTLNNVPEEQAHPMLLIEMPRYAFPFVRQIVSNMTQQAGFVPLLLAPVDFQDFYIQRYGRPQGKPATAAKSA